MTYQGIAKIIPTIQAVALAADNVALVKKKNITTKDMLAQSAKNIVGVSIIQSTAKITGSL